MNIFRGMLYATILGLVGWAVIGVMVVAVVMIFKGQQ
jgi:hypothetical protein